MITVDRKVVEVAGHLYIEAPKNSKCRRTIYPRRTPADYPLAEKIAARMEAARAEQDAGINPLGLIFPSPKFKLCRSPTSTATSSSAPTPSAAGVTARATAGGPGTAWHVFCTTALFTWKLEATDVSCMAGHANVRTTLLMYVGTTAGSSTAPAKPPTNPHPAICAAAPWCYAFCRERRTSLSANCGPHGMSRRMVVSAMLTLAPGCTVAAPSSSGGTPAAVTDGGDGADMRRASSRRSVRRR